MPRWARTQGVQSFFQRSTLLPGAGHGCQRRIGRYWKYTWSKALPKYTSCSKEFGTLSCLSRKRASVRTNDRTSPLRKPKRFTVFHAVQVTCTYTQVHAFGGAFRLREHDKMDRAPEQALLVFATIPRACIYPAIAVSTPSPRRAPKLYSPFDRVMPRYMPRTYCVAGTTEQARTIAGSKYIHIAPHLQIELFLFSPRAVVLQRTTHSLESK